MTAESKPAKGILPYLIALLYVAGYIASDRVTFFNALGPYNITPWNPPPALSLVLVYFYGGRVWPLVFAAVFLSDLVLRALPSPVAAVVVADLALSLAYTGAGMALRRLGVSARLETQRDVIWLVLCGLVFSAVATSAATLCLTELGGVAVENFSTTLFRFWVGDAVGIIVTAPFLLAVFGGRWPLSNLRMVRLNWELMAQMAAIALAAWTVFRVNLTSEFQLLYPLFIPLIWISVRHGLEGAAFGSLALQIGLGLAAILAAEDALRVTELQFAMMAMSATCLLLGASVSERRAAGATVLERERKIRSLVAMVPVGLAEIDGQGRVREANEAMARLARREVPDLLGEEALKVLPGLARLDPHQAEITPDDTDTERRWLEVALAAMEGGGGIAVISDITARKDLERRQHRHQSEMAQLERINAAGQLAATIAHEVNQPLASIIYYTRAAQRLMVQSGGEGEARGAMDKAVAQAMRAGDIIRNLRYFLSRGDAETQSVDLRELAGQVAEFLTVDLQAARVACRLAPGAGPCPVVGDRIQLEQVLLNLMRNAIEALATREGDRRLDVAITGDGESWRLTVADNGPGIAADLAGRMFDPFVTSKRGGMGLGLAISRSIIEAGGGMLDLQSTGPDGTSFVITLPVAKGTET